MSQEYRVQRHIVGEVFKIFAKICDGLYPSDDEEDTYSARQVKICQGFYEDFTNTLSEVEIARIFDLLMENMFPGLRRTSKVMLVVDSGDKEFRELSNDKPRLSILLQHVLPKDHGTIRFEVDSLLRTYYTIGSGSDFDLSEDIDGLYVTTEPGWFLFELNSFYGDLDMLTDALCILDRLFTERNYEELATLGLLRNLIEIEKEVLAKAAAHL